MSTILRAVRLLLDTLIAVLVIGAIAIAALSIVGPRLGYSPVVLRGDSMAPTSPVGSLVIVQPVAQSDLEIGDIVTFKTDNAVFVTHRITRMVERTDGLYLETKGDANAAPDPQIFTATHVVGRAVTWTPGLGYIFDAASIPVFWFTLLGALVSLVLIGSMLDSALTDDRRAGVGSPA